jgi:hypothetical protein
MRSDVAVAEAAVADAAVVVADEGVTKPNPPNNTELLVP